jgi:hypothetical protein
MITCSLALIQYRMEGTLPAADTQLDSTRLDSTRCISRMEARLLPGRITYISNVEKIKVKHGSPTSQVKSNRWYLLRYVQWAFSRMPSKRRTDSMLNIYGSIT